MSIQDSQQHLKHAIEVAYKTNEIAIQTTIELEKQKTQLNNVDKNLDQIDNNTSTAMKHVRNIRSALGSLVNLFNFSSKATTTSEHTSSPEPPPAQLALPRFSVSPPPLKVDRNVHNTEYYSIFDNKELEDVIRQQDKDLDELSSVLSNLHGIANCLNTELTEQSEKIQRITKKINTQNENIRNTTKDVRNLLL